jgi:pimeloyl-ACP methyl ester carboxylesterase
MDQISPGFRVLAADTFGAGRGQPWPASDDVTLEDEAARLEPVFVSAGEPFSFVGHSYGGAIALISALADPDRVKNMVLYEPALFSVLEEEASGQTSYEGISSAVSDAHALAQAGDNDAASERFIDYWMGPGAWASTPEAHQAPISESIVNVAGWFSALSLDPTPLEAFRSLDMPVLYMVGSESPASSTEVARLIISVLPHVEVVKLDGIGHMGPITHPHAVNEIILRFLEEERSRNG